MINPMFIINRNDIVKRICEQTGMSKTECNEAVKDVFEEISAQLQAGNAVNIPGFGKFEIRERAQREGVNPATGEKMEIEAASSIVFKPAKALKDRINEER